MSAVKLVALLSVREGVVPAGEVLLGRHTGEGGFYVQLFDVGLGALHVDLLAIALQFHVAKGGVIGLIVESVRFFEAFPVETGNAGLFLVFELLDFSEHGSFAELNFSLGEVGLGLLQVGGAVFAVGAILDAFLVGLMAEVVEFGLRVAGGVHLGGGVEAGDGVAGLDLSPVGDDVGEGHAAVISGNLGHEHLGGVDGLNDTGDADFAFLAGQLTWGSGSGGLNRAGGTAAGGQERQQDCGCEQRQASAHRCTGRLDAIIRGMVDRKFGQIRV